MPPFLYLYVLLLLLSLLLSLLADVCFLSSVVLSRLSHNIYLSAVCYVYNFRVVCIHKIIQKKEEEEEEQKKKPAQREHMYYKVE